jgi:tetratricopeptide (TPR) repeat protein
MLHQDQAEYPQACQCYEQSLEMAQELGDRAGVARSLLQLGILHQAQREYPQARQHYEQSLEIERELGDRVGVARCLGQMGLQEEQEGHLERAVAALVAAFVCFQQLGMPEQNLAGRALAGLRQKMGVQAFDAAVQAAQRSQGATG